MDSSWLTTRADLQNEMAATYTNGLVEDWDRLLAKLLPGDELWRFGPPSIHQINMGGVALVRDGAVISKVVYWVE